MTAELWWCETHKYQAFWDSHMGARPCENDGIAADCASVRLVRSRDSDGRLLGLIAVEKCGSCAGKAKVLTDCCGEGIHKVMGYCSEPCPACDGRGWNPRARSVWPFGQQAHSGVPYLAGWDDALGLGDGKRGAVLPLPEKEER